jgi:hypothetical protein
MPMKPSRIALIMRTRREISILERCGPPRRFPFQIRCRFGEADRHRSADSAGLRLAVRSWEASGSRVDREVGPGRLDPGGVLMEQGRRGLVAGLPPDPGAEARKSRLAARRISRARSQSPACLALSASVNDCLPWTFVGWSSGIGSLIEYKSADKPLSLCCSASERSYQGWSMPSRMASASGESSRPTAMRAWISRMPQRY